MTKLHANRRNFLKGALAGAGGLMLGGMLPKRALAQESLQNKRFLFAYFEGGWDILLGLDPRDPQTTNPIEHQIELRYDQLGARGQRGVRGVQTVGEMTFGPAVPPEFLAQAPNASIIRSISMDTAAHEVGRRYFLTGRFPRGLAAVGSSTPSEVLAQLGDNTPIPHMSAAVESYARGLPSYATALTVNSITDLSVALTPFVNIDPAVLSAMQSFQDEPAGCEAKKLDRDKLATNFRENQQRARSYIQQQLNTNFDLARQDQEMQALRDAYGIVDGDTIAPNSPEVLSFVAGQALKKKISQCVSVRVATGLDTHANWAADQAPAQERGWRALAAIMADLAATPLEDGSGKSVLDETYIIAMSEFGRTPMFNPNNGRDHHLGNTALIAGPGIRSGASIGQSSSLGALPLSTRLATGESFADPDQSEVASGAVVQLTPKNVIATMLAASGLDYSYLRSQPISALLG